MSYTRTYTADDIRLIRQAVSNESRRRSDAARTRLYLTSGEHPDSFTTQEVDEADGTIQKLDDLLDWLPDPDNPPVVTLGVTRDRDQDRIREAMHEEGR